MLFVVDVGLMDGGDEYVSESGRYDGYGSDEVGVGGADGGGILSYLLVPALHPAASCRRHVQKNQPQRLPFLFGSWGYVNNTPFLTTASGAMIVLRLKLICCRIVTRTGKLNFQFDSARSACLQVFAVRNYCGWINDSKERRSQY